MYGEGSSGWVCVHHLEGRSFSPSCTCLSRWCARCERDLDQNQPMIGTASRRVRALIQELNGEGAL
jgi:hypothetical protein